MRVGFYGSLERQVTVQALRLGPRSRFLAPGPGEMDDRVGAVVNPEGHVIAAIAPGDGGEAVAAEFVARADLGRRFSFKAGALPWFQAVPGFGQVLPGLAVHGEHGSGFLVHGQPGLCGGG